MRNIIGPPVVGDDLYGRDYELARLWEHLENGEHILAPRRVGKTSLMLELKQAPRENWDVIPVDVEGGHGPEDCVAAYWPSLQPIRAIGIEAIPFLSAVKRVLRRLSAKIKIGSLQADLTEAIGSEWDHAAAQLRARLTNLPDTGRKLLITLDELPVLISECCESVTERATPSCCLPSSANGGRRRRCAAGSTRWSAAQSDSKDY